MALIYTDTDLVEPGYLSGAVMDLQEEESENSFTLEMGLDDYSKLSAGCCVFDENNPQFGGMVSKPHIKTAQNGLIWGGFTFAGILSTKIIEPPSGAAYRVLTGTFAQKVNAVLTLIGLSDVFYTDADADGGSTGEWQIDRYTDALTALRKLAAQNDLSMVVPFDKAHEGQKLKISFVTSHTVLAGEEYDSDLFAFDIEKDLMPVTHLICLGSGQLTARHVYHLYKSGADFFYKEGDSSNVYRLSDPEPRSPIDSFLENWSVSDEIVSVYDYSNAESYDELKKEGLKHFQELLDSGTKLEITPPDEAVFRIGDVIAGREQISGIYVEKEVKKIIYKAQDDLPPSITYETTKTKG